MQHCHTLYMYIYIWLNSAVILHTAGEPSIAIMIYKARVTNSYCEIAVQNVFRHVVKAVTDLHDKYIWASVDSEFVNVHVHVHFLQSHYSSFPSRYARRMKCTRFTVQKELLCSLLCMRL